MKWKLLALVFLIVGVAALAVAARGSGSWRPIALLAGFVALFVSSTLLGKAATLARQLAPFVGRKVDVRAWGSVLPEGERFTVVSSRAISAGLHLYLGLGDRESPLHLKIAQPSQVTLSPTSVRIADAKYVQWAGKKLPRPADPSVPALMVNSVD